MPNRPVPEEWMQAEARADRYHEAICDYVDAYEDGDRERAAFLYERLYEIGMESEQVTTQQRVPMRPDGDAEPATADRGLAEEGTDAARTDEGTVEA